MITQSEAQNKLLEITNERKFKLDNWLDRKFEKLKLISTTEKGDIGEDFFSELLKTCGYHDVDVVKNRRGEYDVSVKHEKKVAKFEVKVATLDTNKSFQFNGIRYDTKYTHLFCLGVSPDKIGYMILPKLLVGANENKMVSMAKNTNSTFKLTKRENTLSSFDSFARDIDKLWQEF